MTAAFLKFGDVYIEPGDVSDEEMRRRLVAKIGEAEAKRFTHVSRNLLKFDSKHGLHEGGSKVSTIIWALNAEAEKC